MAPGISRAFERRRSHPTTFVVLRNISLVRISCPEQRRAAFSPVIGHFCRLERVHQFTLEDDT